jgi:predicted dithiol-disulfide oxidoreductase (DUF899 family)
MMGKIVITENVSLDGVIEDPTGVEGSKRGGWFWEIDRGEDGEKFTLEKALGTEALPYYPILDRAPKGRDEGDAFQTWIRRHDEYA